MLRLLLAAGSDPHELELMSRSNALLPACAWDNTQSIEAVLRRWNTLQTLEEPRVIPPPKTNNPPFEDVFPIENGDFPISS